MQNPLILITAICALVGGVGVYPLIKSWPISIHWGKILAACLVLGVCIFARSFLPAVLCVWLLSLIWFPEYWGKFRGFLSGAAIDRESPPLVVAACGWLALIVVPVFVLWTKRQ